MITQNRKVPFLVMAGILILIFAFSASARGPLSPSADMTISKVSQDKYARTQCNIANWSYWFYYDGKAANDPNGDTGGIYPRSTAGMVFTEGIVWGGFHRDTLKVGGQTYNIGTTPGWITTPGDGINPPVRVLADDPRARIYRIRQDFRGLKRTNDDGEIEYDASVLQDAAEVNFISSTDVTDEMQDAVVEQYATDWKEWPVDLGAPYYDEDGNGEYNPVLDDDGYPMIGELNEDGNYDVLYDRPGIAGADQVIWWVVNDLNESRTLNLYGAPPIGLELQITVWGYNQPNGTLGQMFFKKFKFINKSGFPVDSMFVSQWADPDVGNYTDDLAGCDPDLGVGFAYSGYRTDGEFDPFGLPPAAVGFDFFQGPLVEGKAGEDLNHNGVDDAEDFAVFDLKKVGPGYINLPMTSFLYFAAGSAISDPDLGDYDASKEWYNMLNGYIPTQDLDNPTPYTVGNVPDGTPTKFPLSGDPFLGTGDIDGVGLNLPPGDRRIGMCSGPFWMAPGDTQEVVVAVVGGIIQQEGGDNRNAVAQMKLNDAYAQFLYDNLFQGIPSPPTAPNVSVTEFENKVTLDWSFDKARISETERDDPLLGFDFEGYNIYQLPTETASKDQATLVATFDKENFVGIIRAEQFLPAFGDVVEVPIQKGTDSGIQRFITLEQDYINETPLYNGQTYYFAVTAYNYNPDPSVPEPSLESALTPIPVIPQGPKPGLDYGSETGDEIEFTHDEGVAEITVDLEVIDPKKITGDDYQVFFEPWHFYLDKDGQWKRTNYPDSVGEGLAKESDLGGSSLSALAYTSPVAGTRDLKFILDLVAADYDYSDGVWLKFPAEIEINGAEDAIGNAYGHSITPEIDLAENTVFWGRADTTGDGEFSGGEVFTVNVNTPTLPLDVDYTIFDDGWATAYMIGTGDSTYFNLGDGVVHAVGTTTISEEAYQFKTIDMWGLKNLTDNVVVLEGQEQLYDEEIEIKGAPVVDGFKIAVNGSYEAGIDFNQVVYIAPDGTERVVSTTSAGQSGISSYHYSGWSTDGAMAYLDGVQGRGVTDATILTHDYELRFTGEFEPEEVDGQVLMNVKEGTGSMAYLTLARSDDLANHPMNPNPGSNDPFMVRIPFEVWNITTNQQINFHMIDRIQTYAADTVWAFNPNDRMYCEFVNSPYTNGEELTDADLDQMTWNLVFWETPYVTGDVVRVIYPNPIVPGTDFVTFSTEGLGQTELSAAEAKADVDKVGVFPNPYYGYNTAEPDRFTKFVTFNHLPEKVTVRIFDLSGVQVRKLTEQDKQGGVTSQFLRWNLRNESDIPVASGIYIAHVDMPDEGKTKVLKVFIIQSQEMLKYY